MLDHLRAGARRFAAVEDAGRRQAAHRVRVLVPPLRPFAAGLVQLEHAVRLGPAEVQRDAPAGDDRPHAVVHLALVFGLVEAEVQPAAQEVARLRDAARDAVTYLAGQRVGGAGVIGLRGLEEVAHIAPRREAHAQRQRILRLEHHHVQLGRIEAALDADLPAVRRRGGLERGAARPLPVGARNDLLVRHLAARRFAVARDEHVVGGVERRRQVGHRIALHDQALRRKPGPVDDAADHLAGDGRAVAMARDRQLEEVAPGRGHRRAHGRAVVGVDGRVVALPGTGQADVAEDPLGHDEGGRAAAVRHVVPHQSARIGHVDRLGQHEARRVADLAVGTLCQADVLDDRIARIGRFELAEGAPGDLLVGDRLARQRDRRTVEDDARHTGLRRRCECECTASHGQRQAKFRAARGGLQSGHGVVSSLHVF